MARAATEVAATLRRQIHRQMYRLGQSSLPTEGVGPVINLWTREVNDVRDGVMADLDATPRLHVLAGGLLIIALLVSPILTVFLASLGILVWLISRVLDRDARQANEIALRDASVQLCLLHEDLGLFRTVRVYGVGEYDRQRFDEHLERYQQADTRRIVTSMPLNPSTGLLYGAGAGNRTGVARLQRHRQRADHNCDDVDPAGFARGAGYPVAEWLRMRKAIRHANRSARGDLRVSRAAARASPERRCAFPERAQGPDRHRKRRARKPLGPPAARGRVGRDSCRLSHRRSWATRTTRSSPWLA